MLPYPTNPTIPRHPKASLILGALLLLLLLTRVQSHATIETEPTPFTALLDFTLLRGKTADLHPDGLPIWLESVQITQSELLDPAKLERPKEPLPFAPRHTTFRLRLRDLPGLNDALLLRLFFHDKPYHQPVVTGWSETGQLLYTSRPLGLGIDLPTSEALTIPTEGVDYLEINIPGDGSTLRQALATTLRTRQIQTAIDFPTLPVAEEKPASPSEAEEKDTALYGRVRATLEPGVIKIEPGFSPEDGTLVFEFDLASSPLIALISFELLNADPSTPLLTSANEESIGPVAMQLPDLSDPAYTGIARPLEKMSFRYSGWVKAQKIIPGRLLHTGQNRFTIQLPNATGAVAVRSVEIQLKHPWKKLDYILSPL